MKMRNGNEIDMTPGDEEPLRGHHPMTTPAPSPLPWKWMRENDEGQMIPCKPSWKAKQYSGNKYICDANGKKIMGVGEYDIMESDNDDADAAFVIDAVNAYPLVAELVQELKKAAEMCRYDKVPKTVDHWDALIAKANAVMGESK